MTFELPPPAVTDEGRRLHEAVTLHILANPDGATGRWVAARLSDGGTDNVLYDTNEDAIRHPLHEKQCAYMCISPAGTTEREATRFLQLWRQFYDAGHRNVQDIDVNPLYRKW
jgi:hypothetical protein